MNDTNALHDHRILILDFGSQTTQLIARRIREIGVYCEIHPWDWDDASVHAFAPAGIILSGGPESTTVNQGPRAPAAVFQIGVPVLGICYGMQTMAMQLGGEVAVADHREFGYARVNVWSPGQLFEGIEDHVDDKGTVSLDVWMSHGDHVTALPPGFHGIAATDNAPIVVMADENRRFYGVQFHPEVTHTRQGGRLLERFVHDLCGCRALWNTGNILSASVEQVVRETGNDQVLLGLSGGVDSSVVAALLHRAIGDRLTCIFVDNGLLRHNEGDQVMATFARHMGIRVVRVNAGERFLNALKGVADPERKRHIIGNTFVEIFEEEANKLDNARWLAQGTIYPDVVESAGTTTGKAKVIKSHHNVAGLPERMNLKLLEPLRELFKDEVRKLGIELGLPADMVYRHPFPGPGLAVRILGAIEPDHVRLLQQADDIFIGELRCHQLYDKVSQAFAVFLPVRSVGVMGDSRRYDYVIALRAVETVDFMTARWAYLPYDFLDHVARRIVNEIDGISRVVYDISGKPPATIEWE